MDMPTAVSSSETLDLESLNAMFEVSAPIKSIEWAVAQFGRENVVMSSSFGAESAVMLHMATQIIPEIKVIFVNTGYLFPETHAHMEDLRLRLNLNVWIYRTRNDPIGYLRAASEENPAWRNNIPTCCGVNKNEPFERAMRDLRPKCWLRGIRRSQASTRSDRQFVEWSSRFSCHAVSPLLNINSREIFNYMKLHGLPYHPLFDKGYASIGCNPLSCTRPIQIGEDARSGRWAGSDKIECGINVDSNSLDSAQI